MKLFEIFCRSKPDDPLLLKDIQHKATVKAALEIKKKEREKEEKETRDMNLRGWFRTRAVEGEK